MSSETDDGDAVSRGGRRLNNRVVNLREVLFNGLGII